MKIHATLLSFALILCVSKLGWADTSAADPTNSTTQESPPAQQSADEPLVALSDGDNSDDNGDGDSDGTETPTSTEYTEATDSPDEPTEELSTAPADEVAQPVDYQDSAARSQEISDICDAACAGAVRADLCIDSCESQTHACFDECDTLPAKKNDCFLGCTHIAVDERDRQEQAIESHLQAIDEKPVYGRKFAFGMNFVGGLHQVPNFLVGAFFQRSNAHWLDKPKFFYGGELVFRFDDKQDLLLTIDYADYRTQDGWWLEKKKNATAAEWVHNDMRALAITIGWNGIANLDKRKRVQLYGGIGLGMILKIGDFNKAKVRLGCVNADTELSVYDDLPIHGPCPDDNGTVLINQDPTTGEITDWTQEKIPSVLPSLVATLGFRYIIADTVSIGVEGGWKTVAFYGGLKVGFVVGKSNAKRAREETQEALRP